MRRQGSISLRSKIKLIECVLYKVMKGLTMVCLVGLLTMVTLQVLARFLRIRIVVDDLVTLLNVWMIFIGSSILVRDKSHVAIEVEGRLFAKSKILRISAILVTHGLVIFFLLFIIKSGMDIVKASFSAVTPMLRLPQWWWYLPLPLSGVLMLLWEVKNMLKALNSIIKEAEGDESSKSVGRKRSGGS
ncbi:TRAP transporter small permease [Pseudothermotoga sp.]|nr:TRAP transporter small permease [Pseudothermotoga sp.]MDW8140529.1 TRAP transporter small permease [Pseudothermotoga sp.]